MSYLNVRHLGTTTHEWLNTLDFYDKEIAIMDERLLEIAGKNTGKEVTPGIEHFQNQFSIHLLNIRDLKHRIRDNDKQAASDIQLHSSHVGQDLINAREIIGEDMKRFEKTMKELRQEFNAFVSKWI